MAVGLAFVDIVGDTSRTEPQVERDMSRVLATVQDALAPVEIQAAVEAGTERDLTNELRADIRAAQQAIDAINVDARLSPATRTALTAELRSTIGQARAAIGEIDLRVAARPIVQQTVQAVQTAVRVAEAAAPPIELETTVDNDRVGRLPGIFKGIGGAASAAVPSVAGLAKTLIGFSSAVQSAAGVTAVLGEIAPAAALAAPAIATVGVAMGAVKLATVGFSDAVAAAFDPSDPEAYADALKKLAPNARAVVQQLHEMQPALRALQQDVQNRVFAGFDQSLRDLAVTALPVVSSALKDAADALNAMGRSAAGGVQALAEDGALGTALGSATRSLAAFSDIPGRVAIAFGQLAAAAGPSLERLASGAAGAIKDALDGLSGSFAEGSLQTLIEGAITQLGTLVKVLGNVASIVGSVLASVQASGSGVLSVLEEITGVLAKALATPEAQDALFELFAAVNLLTSTALPLLGDALKIVGQTLKALLPGVRLLITALGQALGPVVKALGPVLVAMGEAVSQAVAAFAPLLVVAGQLIARLLPALTPLIQFVADLFVSLAPLIQTVATLLLDVLSPILAVLPTILKPFVDLIIQLVNMALPIFQDIIVALSPALIQLSQTFADLAAALLPVIARVLELWLKLNAKLLPILQPIIKFIGDLANIFSDELAYIIDNIVIPALTGLSQLLSGDFSGAWRSFKEAARGAMEEFIRLFTELPQKILGAVGNLENSLYNVGRDIITGLIRGVESKLGDLRGALGRITNLLPDWKGPAERDRTILTPSGQMVMDGFITGIRSRRPDLRKELGAITGMMPTATIATAPMQQLAAPAHAAPVPNVQVFIGEQELTQLVNAQIGWNNRQQARLVSNGMRY